MTPPLTRRPSTPADLSIPHSGMCDAPRGLCTCGAGLVRLVVGK